LKKFIVTALVITRIAFWEKEIVLQLIVSYVSEEKIPLIALKMQGNLLVII